MVRYARYWIGRRVVHAGLRMMPPGTVRQQLFDLFNEWGRHVTETVERDQRLRKALNRP